MTISSFSLTANSLKSDDALAQNFVQGFSFNQSDKLQLSVLRIFALSLNYGMYCVRYERKSIFERSLPIGSDSFIEVESYYSDIVVYNYLCREQFASFWNWLIASYL